MPMAMPASPSTMSCGNMMRVRDTVSVIMSGLNPGATKRATCGAKRMPRMDTSPEDHRHEHR